MPHMQTYSGRQYWPADPRPEDVEIIDIAESLSKQSRYGGHCLRFYSVAEHCVLMARHLHGLGHDNATCFEALMHDASEAYLVDVPRPIKKRLAGYAEIENLNMLVIAQRFGFAWPVSVVVQDADNRILLDEREQNMAPPPDDWNIVGPPLGVTIQCWHPEDACENFLAEYSLRHAVLH